VSVIFFYFLLFSFIFFYFLLFPSISFDFIRFHSISFDFLRFPSISFDFLRFPSISFDFLRFPSIFFYFLLFSSIFFYFLLFSSIFFYFLLFSSLPLSPFRIASHYRPAFSSNKISEQVVGTTSRVLLNCTVLRVTGLKREASEISRNERNRSATTGRTLQYKNIKI
jgi:hypothetical protein